MHSHPSPPWPKLSTDTSHAWQVELAQAANRLSSLAGRISPYPGGGSPAHKLRQAAKLADEARAWLQEEGER